jgi:uncharacterized protein (DUF58 family)
MTRAASPRLEGYVVVVAVALVAALALRRPELAVVAAPFALTLALGLRSTPEPVVAATLVLPEERVVEEEELPASIEVRATSSVERLELLLSLPSGVVVADGPDGFALRLRAGEERSLPVTLRCSRWGIYDVGRLELRARDAFRIVTWQRGEDDTSRLKAYPRAETLTHILPPRETQVFTGSEVARTKGDGIEYADLREYVPGDRLRSINWRASARRSGLVVNEQHPERNTDVVLFVDSFADVRHASGRSTLDDAVRATATLASRYLERRDRVGLVTFGGILRWLQPGMGTSQLFRLVETLLETGVEPTYMWRDVNVIPARILPPKALILAVTPLLDARFVTTVADLRARGFDVAVVEVDPVSFVEPGRSEPERLAYRLWLLDREVLRARLLRLGIAVARWGKDTELAAALEGVRTYRRRAGLARA